MRKPFVSSWFNALAAALDLVALLLLLVYATEPPKAQAFFVGAPPMISFLDLDSGPVGAPVCVYGWRFGATQGGSTISVNGTAVTTYYTWGFNGTDQTQGKACFSIPSGATTGTVTLTTSDGSSTCQYSGYCTFTVRSGTLRYVATTGSNSNDGSIGSPWLTVPYGGAHVSPGDVLILRSNVKDITDDGSGWSTCFLLPQSGTSGNPIAVTAYPGETGQQIGNTIGSGAGGCDTGIRVSTQRDYWTFANIAIRGVSVAANTSGFNFRYVGNDVSCPNGNGQAGCLDVTITSGYKVYGNYLNHVGTNNAQGTVTALYHGFYLSEQNDNFDFGWNTIAFVHGCRGFQQFINSGPPVFNIALHDNIIHDIPCDGIIMGQTDVGTSGHYTKVWNNIVYNTGQGPNNAEATGAWTCMWLSNGGTGTGQIEVYNNTMYNCDSFLNPPYNQSSAMFMWAQGSNFNVTGHLVSNILDTNFVDTKNGQIPYLNMITQFGSLCLTAPCNELSGDHNVLFGAGAVPSYVPLTSNINSDPLFTDASAADFSLQMGSPALHACSDTAATSDIYGNVRISGMYSCGAVEQASTSASAATPTATPGSGTYPSSQSVSLSTVTSGAFICFRTDGMDPSATTPGTCDPGSITYTTSIAVTTSTTIKALATKSGLSNSLILTANYVIQPTGNPGFSFGGSLTFGGGVKVSP